MARILLMATKTDDRLLRSSCVELANEGGQGLCQEMEDGKG